MNRVRHRIPQIATGLGVAVAVVMAGVTLSANRTANGHAEAAATLKNDVVALSEELATVRGMLAHTEDELQRTATELATIKSEAAPAATSAAPTALVRQFTEPPLVYAVDHIDKSCWLAQDGPPLAGGPASRPAGETLRDALAANLDELTAECGGRWWWVPTDFMANVVADEGATATLYLHTREGFVNGAGTETGTSVQILVNWDYVTELEASETSRACAWSDPTGTDAEDAARCDTFGQVTK